MVFFDLNTGLRKSELLNLEWNKHVDLINEQLIFPGKGDKDRVVPLNTHALSVLQKRPRHIYNQKVFWEIKNQIAIDSMWKTMRKRTEIKGRFHDLRKTFASYYVMNGGSLERLREILGHEDYGTVKIYETLSPDSLHRDKNIIAF
jgi:integrase